MPATVLLAAVVVAVAVLQSHPEFRLASAGPSTDVVMVVAAGCKGGTDSDFNGDGYRDTAIADPKATVNGLADAGRVSVVYGNVDDLHPDGGLIDVLQQGAGGIPGGAEAGDEFGHALAVYDANKDGCSDLVVSAPFEDTGAAVDGGAAVVLFGSPSGLGKGPATIWYDQNAPGWGDDNESGDWFGYSLTAGATAAGEPYLAIGVPGEDYGTALDAGAVHYLRSAVNAVLHAGSGLGVSGSAEIDDRVGYSLASSPYHLAIGSPGEALGSTVWAGVVHVFGHELVNGLPKVLGVLGHDNGGGTVDPFDSFGESISMVGYRPAGAPAGQPNSLLVVGVPGDDVGDVVDAGALHRYQVTATGYTHLGATTAATPGVGGDVRAGDYFGRQVRVINTQPDAVASPQTVQIAVGVPGRDVGGVTDAGSVDVFAGVTDPITPADLVLDLTVFSTPLNPNTMYGAHLGVSPEYLFVAHSEAGRIGGAVNGYEWAALAAGRKTVSMAFNDGIDGIPRNGTAFGWAIG